MVSKKLFLSLLLGLLANFSIQAQASYTDHKPRYSAWTNRYNLDKIEYTDNRTIFYFRFVCGNDAYTHLFAPQGVENPWYLYDVHTLKNIDLLEIKNIKRNNELIAPVLVEELFIPALNEGETTFTCEIHFSSLPEDAQTLNLIEGQGNEQRINHFNFFDIEVKKARNNEDATSE